MALTHSPLQPACRRHPEGGRSDAAGCARALPPRALQKQLRHGGWCGGAPCRCMHARGWHCTEAQTGSAREQRSGWSRWRERRCSVAGGVAAPLHALQCVWELSGMSCDPAAAHQRLPAISRPGFGVWRLVPSNASAALWSAVGKNSEWPSDRGTTARVLRDRPPACALTASRGAAQRRRRRRSDSLLSSVDISLSEFDSHA